jgi:hypothetical protein
MNDWCANLDALKAYASDNGYRIVGDVYETELSVYSGNFQDSLSAELAVLVEKDCPEREPAERKTTTIMTKEHWLFT